MSEDNERFKRPQPRTKRTRKAPADRGVLKDNSLLLDRPFSIWTISVFAINGAFFGILAVGQSGPVWLNLLEPLLTLPWLAVFLKGGAWQWIAKFIPDQKKKEEPS